MGEKLSEGQRVMSPEARGLKRGNDLDAEPHTERWG